MKKIIKINQQQLIIIIIIIAVLLLKITMLLAYIIKNNAINSNSLKIRVKINKILDKTNFICRKIIQKRKKILIRTLWEGNKSVFVKQKQQKYKKKNCSILVATTIVAAAVVLKLWMKWMKTIIIIVIIKLIQ